MCVRTLTFPLSLSLSHTHIHTHMDNNRRDIAMKRVFCYTSPAECADCNHSCFAETIFFSFLRLFLRFDVDVGGDIAAVLYVCSKTF
jgi:hypothetical protein